MSKSIVNLGRPDTRRRSDRPAPEAHRISHGMLTRKRTDKSRHSSARRRDTNPSHAAADTGFMHGGSRAPLNTPWLELNFNKPRPLWTSADGTAANARARTIIASQCARIVDV